MNNSKIGIVIPSLNCPFSLDKVLESIFSQSRLPDKVIVVEQTHNFEALQFLEKWKSRVLFVHSDVGVSKARNIGISKLSDMDIIGFLDDDACMVKDYLEKVELLLKSSHAVSGQVIKGGLKRLPYNEKSLELNRFSVWRNAIEAGLFITRTFLCFSYFFDENLGLGSETPAKSGEGTDFLLRGISMGLTVVYDPSLQIIEFDTEMPRSALARKKYEYAVGTGVVIGRFYAFPYWPYFLLGPLKRIRNFHSSVESILIIVGRINGLRLSRRTLKQPKEHKN